MPVNTTIKIRKGTEAEWQSSNPILASGEPGYVTDTNRFKIGNGSTNWNSLSYAAIVPSGFIGGSGINLNLGSNGSSLSIGISGSFVASTGYFDVLSFNTNTEPVLSQGQIAWNDTEGTVDIALTDTAIINIGEHEMYRVRNTTSNILYKGQAVYASGVHTNGIISPNLYTADGSIREIRFMGLVYENVNNNNNGYIIHFGHINNIDTRGNVASNIAVGDETWSDGDILYVHPTVAGKLTKNEPKHSIAAAIILDAASNGKLFVRPTSYGHLNDNHDVAVSGATNGQFLQYNSATDYWVPSSSGNFSTLLVNGTGVSLIGHTHVSGDLPADVVYLDANQTLTNKTLDAPDIIDGVFSDTFTIGSQVFYEQSTNGFSVNEDFDPSNSSTQTAYHFTTGPGRETLAFTLARTSQFTDGFGIYGTSSDNTFVTFGEQSNTKFEWRRGVGIRPLDLDGGTLLMRLDTGGHLNVSGSGIFGSGVDINGVADFSSTIEAPNLGIGEDNSVVILDSDGKLRTDEIDPRVWGSSLVDGNGTANYSAKWSDGDTLSSGIIYDNGTNIGIGTSSPSYKLDVIGTGNFSQNLLVNGTPVSVSGHTHVVNDITDFATGVADEVSTTLSAGTGIALNYDSGTDTLTINVSGLINNPSNNRILTSRDNTTTGIDAESNLTFDGNTFVCSGNARIGDYQYIDVDGGLIYIKNADNSTIMSFEEYSLWDSSQQLSIYWDGKQLVNGSDVVLDWSNNKVGIKTVTPVYTLDVNGSGNFASGLAISNQTASTIAGFDSNKNVTSLSTSTYPSLTELSYVKGVTSSIQTQINAKQNSLTNPVTGTGISNHIAYWNTSSGIVADSGQLYWDSTNSRLGIGTNSPQQLIHISGATTAFAGIRFDNSSGQGGTITAANNMLYVNSAFRVSSSKIRLGDGSSAGSIELTSAGSISQDGNGGGLTFSGTTGRFSNSLEITGNVTVNTTGVVLGSGTINYAPRWLSSSILSTGLIFDNGSSVMIGGNSTSFRLDVSSTSNNIMQASVGGHTGFDIKRSSNGYSELIVKDVGGRTIAVTSHPNDLSSTIPYIAGIAQGIGNGVTLSTANVSNHHISLRSRGDFVFIDMNTNSQIVNIKSGGNVGIGVAAPSTKLDVAGSIKSSGLTVWQSQNNVSALDIKSSGGTYTHKIYASSTGYGLMIESPHSIQYSGAVSGGSHQFILGSEAWRMTKDTLAPGVASASASGGIYAPIDGFLGFGTIGSTALYKTFAINNRVGNDYGVKLLYTTGGNLTDGLVLDNTGKVGIGKSTPSYSIDVIGTGNFSQNLLVNGTGVSLNGHTHIVSDITDFSTGVADEVNTTLTAGSGIVLDYDSGTDTLTIHTSGVRDKTLTYFTPLDNQPPASNFATLDTRNSIAVLDFDDTTEESAVFVGVLPENAVLGSGISVRIHWMATSATTGSCRWGVQFEKMNTDLDSDSFDTATEAHSTTNGTSGTITTTSITCTSIDSLAAGDLFRIKIYRDVTDTTNDTMTGDAEIVAIELRSVL